VLDVPQVRAPRPSGRKPHWAPRLAGLATKPGEICGLDELGTELTLDLGVGLVEELVVLLELRRDLLLVGVDDDYPEAVGSVGY